MTLGEKRAARLVELLTPLCEAERVAREIAALTADKQDLRMAFKLGSLRVQVDTEIAVDRARADRARPRCSKDPYCALDPGHLGGCRTVDGQGKGRPRVLLVGCPSHGCPKPAGHKGACAL